MKTLDELLTMDDRERDAEVARKVFGWHVWEADEWVDGHPIGRKSPCCTDAEGQSFSLPFFSWEASAAFRVLSFLDEKGWYWEAGNTPRGHRCRLWQADGEKWRKPTREVVADAEKFPTAVACAALLAVGDA